MLQCCAAKVDTLKKDPWVVSVEEKNQGKTEWERDGPAEEDMCFLTFIYRGIVCWACLRYVQVFFDYGGSKLSEQTQKYVTDIHDKSLWNSLNATERRFRVCFSNSLSWENTSIMKGVGIYIGNSH